MTVRALVSIGTNSTRAIVARLEVGTPPAVLLARSTETRIGEGLKARGHLDEAAMRRTLEAIREHAQAIREYTGDLRIIATSALRRADNEREFDERVRELAGAGVEIISGDEEAACSYAGALSGIDAGAGERFGVLDVGGGSSEYAAGTKAGCDRVVSCEIGAVRLTEELPELSGSSGRVTDAVLERAGRRAAQALEPALRFPAVDRLVLVGGSCTTAVAILRGRAEFFRYAQLTAEGIESLIERLAALPLDRRKELPGINPQRADILLGGLLIVREFMQQAQHAGATVSTSDVLLGYLLRHPA